MLSRCFVVSAFSCATHLAFLAHADSPPTIQVTVEGSNGALPLDASGAAHAPSNSQVFVNVSGPVGESVGFYLYKTANCTGPFTPYGNLTIAAGGTNGPLTTPLASGTYSFGTGSTVTFPFGMTVPSVNGVKLSSAVGELAPTLTYVDKATRQAVSATARPADSSTNPDLWVHRGDPDETGLGMANDPTGANELYVGSGFIELDLSSLPTAAILSFQMSSTEGGEAWAVYGSNVRGVRGSALVASGSDQLMDHTLPAGYKYFDFVSDGVCTANAPSDCGGVLVHSITLSPIPFCQTLIVDAPQGSDPSGSGPGSSSGAGGGCDATGQTEGLGPYSVLLSAMLFAAWLLGRGRRLWMRK